MLLVQDEERHGATRRLGRLLHASGRGGVRLVWRRDAVLQVQDEELAPHGGSDDSGVPVGEEECISCGGLGGWGMDVSPRYDGRH